MKDPNKARAFSEALGYTMKNADRLVQNIREHALDHPFTDKGDTPYGRIYEIRMKLVGENGKEAQVTTGWIVDKETGITRLTSAYVSKKESERVIM